MGITFIILKLEHTNFNLYQFTISNITEFSGNSLVVQWLGLCSLTAMGLGSLHGLELKYWEPCWQAKKKFFFLLLYSFICIILLISVFSVQPEGLPLAFLELPHLLFT